MTLKKLMKNNRLLVKLVLSYLITSVLITSLLMIVVSNFVSTRIEKQTTESAMDLLRQSYSTAYYALTDLYGDYYDLWTNDQLILNGLDSNFLNEQEMELISERFDREKFRNDLIDSVYLINKSTNKVISDESTYEIEDFYDQDALRLFKAFDELYDVYKDEIFFPRHIENNAYNSDEKLISIIYANKDLDGILSSGIIVNISQDKLSSLINSNNELSNILIVNGRGIIISDSKGTSGLTLPRDDFYLTIANTLENEGSFTGNYQGEKSFITYKKAEDLGFVFLSITPYSYLKDEITTTNSYMAIFYIISMIVSLIVSYISTKKIYAPLNYLIEKMKDNPSIESTVQLDEYAFLGETYNSLILKDKESHLARIFNGSFTDTSMEVLGYTTNNKFMTFALIPDDEALVNNEFLDKIIKIINQNTNWTSTITSNCVSCVINSNNFSDEKLESIMEALINLQELISEELNTTVSIGLGTVINDLDSIKFSHRYATLAAQYALNNGESKIILYGDIEDSKVAASQNKDSIAGKIQEYVDNNFNRQDFSVDEIANEVELSLGYIRQIFKNEKGITLNDYIINKRIEMAKVLLSTTDKTAKDIAEEVGYYDNRYFYTLFKKKIGMTTEEYRKLEGEAITGEVK